MPKDGTSIKEPGKARALVEMKGLEDFVLRERHEKDPLRRHRSDKCNKAADPAPDEECTRLKPLRVRKTVQNRRIDFLATDSDRRNRCRRHTSGEVSPRQCCHCSSTLVSRQKDVGTVTAEYTGY